MTMWSIQEIEIARKVVQEMRSRSVPYTTRKIKKELKKLGIEKTDAAVVGFLARHLR